MASISATASNPHVEEWYSNDGYLSLHPTWFIHEAPWKAGLVLRMIERHGLRPDYVVDVGCGVGGVLDELSRLMPGVSRFEGYDVATAAIAGAQTRASDRVTFAQRDVSELSGIKPDLLLVLDILDHIEDPFNFLRQIKPLCNKIILHMSIGLSVQRVARPNGLLARRRQGELHFYSKETAFELFESAGFRITDSFYTNMSLDLNDAFGRLKDGSGDKPAIHWRNFLMRMPRRVMSTVSPDLAARWLGGYHIMLMLE